MASAYVQQGISLFQKLTETLSESFAAGAAPAATSAGGSRARSGRPTDHGDGGDSSVSGFLSRNESVLVTIQKIVLWENAVLSSIFLTCFTFVYWYLASMRPLGLLFEAALVYYGYYVVHEYVWKKISVSPTQEQAADMRETDDWTLMERGVFSAPEMNIALLKLTAAAQRLFETFLAFRRDQPRNYAIMMLGVLSSTAFVGSLVSGPVLLYAVALFLFTAPGMIHNSAQLNQMFWNMICGPDPSPEADKHVEEFMWKASREDLRVLEKAAAPAVPDESLLMEINGGNGAAAFDDDHHAAPVSKDSSDSGSIVDETMEKIGHDDLHLNDEDDASSFEEYDPGDFPSLDTTDGVHRRAPRL